LRRRLAKITILSLMTVATVCAAIIGAVYWRLSEGPISLDFMREKVQAEINRNLSGMEVRLAGVVVERDAETRVPQFRLRNLELLDADGNTIARAPRAAISVDESGLLTGNIVPRELELIGPRIMIKRAISGGFVMGFGRPSEPDGDEVSTNEAGKSDHASVADDIMTETRGAEIIDALSAPAVAEGKAGKSTIASVDFIRISRAQLTLFDEANNAYWNASDADLAFSRMPYGFAVVAEMSIQSEGAPIQAEISASYRRAEGDFGISARIVNFVPSAASRKIYALSQLARVNVPLAGQAELRMTEAGQITRGTAEFTVDAGQIAFPDFIADPIMVDEGSLRLDYDPQTGGVVISDSSILVGSLRAGLTGRIDPVRSDDKVLRALKIAIDARSSAVDPSAPADPYTIDRIDFRGIASIANARLDMDDLLVMSGDSGLRLRGIFTGGERSPGINLAGRVRNMPAPLLKKIWPPIVAPNTRKWIHENIKAGSIRDGEITVHLAENDLAQSKDTKELPSGSVRLHLALDDVSTSYFKSLPLIVGASGEANLEDNKFSIRLDKGAIELPSGKSIGLTGGAMTLVDLLKPVTPAEFRIAATASVPTVFEYMSLPDLDLLKTARLDVGKLSGQADMDITLSMPFMKNLPREQVKVSAKAKVTDASLKQALDGIDVTDGSLVVNVEPGRISGEGPVKLNGIPAKLTWLRQTGGSDVHTATIETELDDKQRDKIGAKVGGFLSGPIKVKATIPEIGNPQAGLKVEADLSKASMMIDAINWSRAPSRGTKASFSYLKSDSGAVIGDLSITGGDLVLKGEVRLGKNGSFSEAKLSKMRLNDENEFAVTLKRSGEGMAMTIDGESFDARPLIKSMFSSSGGSTGEKEENPTTYFVTAKIDRVYAHRGEVIAGLNGTLVSRGNSVLNANLQGNFLSGHPINLRIQPVAGGREFRIGGRDGGSALRAANLYSKVAGGQIEFYALLGQGQQGGVRKGQLNLRNFEVRNEAALAELDARGRPKKSGPRSDSIAFNRLQLPFTTDARFLRIGDAEVSGNEICATVDKGLIRKADGAIDIDGTIIPACGLNNIPGKIPVVELLVGDGLFALTYALYGTISNPKFQYNPISAVAPGILRKFFEFGDATPGRPLNKGEKSN
jgi:hypothetical protein